MQKMNNDHIAHSGIKGQKWGIRRFQYENGSLTEEGKERYGRTPKKEKKPKPESATWKSKEASDLSDAELNRRISRLQREEQYKRMTQTKGQKAAKWIAATASTVLVASAIGMLKGKMSKVYKDAIDKYGPIAVNAIKNKIGKKA